MSQTCRVGYLLFFCLLLGSDLFAAEPIRIVGSSTVYTFAKKVSENFSTKTGYPLPQIVPTGSGGGLKEFCKGSGDAYPDITNASRRINRSEFDLCHDHGVTGIIEVKIGYDGIVVAGSSAVPAPQLTLRDLYLALAAQVPAPDGTEQLVDNPYISWNQIRPELSERPIEVLGPPPTSGTRDAFSELALEKACQQYPWIKSIKKRDKHRFRKICHTLRTDGHFIEAGERDDLIVKNLEAAPKATGIFGYNFLAQDAEKLSGATIEGVKPEVASIASGAYPLSRPLYFYVKAERIDQVPGLAEYLLEFTSEEAWGPGGYLAALGLVTMPDKERDYYRQVVVQGSLLSLD